MMVVNVRSPSRDMAGPSTRLVTIRRDAPVASSSRPAPGPQRYRWECKFCRKMLSSKRSYDEHMNIHNETRPFKCDHCDYAAASQMTLRRHNLRSHTPREDWHYKCPYCGESYMEPASYQQHVSSRHFGYSATFGCPYSACPFQTKCSKHFREHLTKHHNCVTQSRRSTTAATNGEGSSNPAAAPPQYAITDKNMRHYIVDDDLGVGWGRRAVAVVQRSAVVVDDDGWTTVSSSSPTTAASTSGGGGGSTMTSSSMTSSTTSMGKPVMLRVKKEDRTEELSTGPSHRDHPLTSSRVLAPHPPHLLSANDDDSPPVTTTSTLISNTIFAEEERKVANDEDFMKAPITLRRRPPPPPHRAAIPRRVTLAPPRLAASAHGGPPTLVPQQRRSVASGMKYTSHHQLPRGGLAHTANSSSSAPPLRTLPAPSPPAPVLLGGSRTAPAMISGDAADWIEHEEIVAAPVTVYPDGSVDFPID